MKLEICDVSKQYKDKCAVDHASLTLTPGVWGLLGANGRKIQRYLRISAAGIRILSGILGTGLSGIYGYIKRNRQKRDKRKDTGTSGIGITYGCQKEENQQIIRRNETPCGNRTGIVE